MGGVDAKLVVRWILRVPRRSALDQECLVLERRSGAGFRAWLTPVRNDEDEYPVCVWAVGDPVFCALEHPAPCRFLGRRGHRLRVRTAHRLGQSKASESLAARNGDKDALLLLFGTELVDGVTEERVVDAH